MAPTRHIWRKYKKRQSTGPQPQLASPRSSPPARAAFAFSRHGTMKAGPGLSAFGGVTPITSACPWSARHSFKSPLTLTVLSFSAPFFFNMCTNMAATQTNGHKGTRKRSADQNDRLIQRILASQRHVKRGGSSENHPEGDAMGWIHGAAAWAFASEQQDMISQHRLVCFNFSPKSGRLSENIKWLTLVCS